MKPIKIKGMAMLEVLIAMLVFALALIPLVRLQVKSMDATRAGFYKTETAAAAESMMDYLMTDVAEFFPETPNDPNKESRWGSVVATSGENCDKSTPQQKIACNILNSHGGKFHADGNAVLCVFGERPEDENSEKLDKYKISIRAIWYSGRRGDPKNSTKYYSKDLKEADCGTGYDSDMNSEVVGKDNIDSIKIDMAY